MKKRSHEKQTSNSPVRKRSMFASCLLGFFGVLFFLLQAPHAAQAHAHAQIKASEIITAKATQTGADVIFYTNPPAHMPMSSRPSPAEVEVTDEREVDDDTKEEAKEMWANLLTNNTYPLGSGQLLFPDFLQSIRNRSTVSLFVLHHSWKSFIC